MHNMYWQIFLAISAALLPSAAWTTDVSAEVAVVSDYRFRGVSASGGKPALQMSFDLAAESGAYASVWSSLHRSSPGHIASEVDVTVGYEVPLRGAVALDVSVAYYAYPEDRTANYVEATAALTATRGSATGRVGISFVPRQRGTRDDLGTKRDNSYAFAGLEYGVKALPLSLNAQIGVERGAFDAVERGGKVDLSLGAEARPFAPLRASLTYTGANTAADAHGLVAGLAVEF